MLTPLELGLTIFGFSTLSFVMGILLGGLKLNRNDIDKKKPKNYISDML